MNFLKKMKTNTLVTALLYIILGLLFVLLPGITMRTICYILAAALAVVGIMYIVDYLRTWEVSYQSNGLALGILAVAASLFLFLKTNLAISAIPVLLGFAVLVSGILKVQNAIVLRRMHNKTWPYVLVAAVLCLALGVVLIENPFDAARTLVVVIGAGLLFSGLTDVMVVLLLSRRAKDRDESIL